MTYEVLIDGAPHRVELEKDSNLWRCRVDDQEIELDAAMTTRDVMSILVYGKAHEVKCEYSLNGDIHLILGSERFAVEVRDPRSFRSRKATAKAAEGPQKITAPMPGKIVRIMVSAGDEVEAGQGILVVEAMKMQNEIKSPKKGKVSKVSVAEGSAVNSGDTLAIVE
jgi:biotin carboxyl carrier protein